MLYEVNGNLLSGKYDIICHQVNCRGAMGAGLAKQIRNKYPIAYEDYRTAYEWGLLKLGTNLYTCVEKGKFCVQMCAQDRYGHDKRYTDYDAFQSCLDSLAHRLEENKVSEDKVIAFPYLIGCGLAGGDWNIIKEMLKDFSNRVKQKVVIVKWVKSN